MNRKKLLLGTGTLLGIATLAFAHHVPMGLSYVAGREILSVVKFFTATGQFGVPAYKVGDVEAPEHGEPVGLVAGDGFSVMDQDGNIQKVVLEEADFDDIETADMDEVVEAINAKSTLLQAAERNGFLVLEGVSGGFAKSLAIADDGALGKMGMSGGQVFGSDDITLTLSIPDPDLDLAGAPFLMLTTTLDGSFTMQGFTVPLGRDPSFFKVRNVHAGSGFLDANSDATVTITGAQIQRAFAGNYPDELYAAFLVFGHDGRIAYVSNRFTIDFE
jgi:hypothetical protein